MAERNYKFHTKIYISSRGIFSKSSGKNKKFPARTFFLANKYYSNKLGANEESPLLYEGFLHKFKLKMMKSSCQCITIANKLLSNVNILENRINLQIYYLRSIRAHRHYCYRHTNLFFNEFYIFYQFFGYIILVCYL